MSTEHEVTHRLAERVRAGLPLRVGIVGFGASPHSWAETAHLPALLAVPGVELHGVSASSLESAQTAAQRHDIPHAFAAPAELADHDDIDVVVISVRVPLHQDAIEPVLGKSKLVFSEWPLGIDTAQARQLTADAAASGTPTKVGLQARFNPPVAYVRDLVADGFVGDVLSSSIIGSAHDWGPTTNNGNEYLIDEHSGATMRTIAVGHALDAMAYVLGEPTDLRMQQATRRAHSQNTDTNTAVKMTAADQVWFSGRARDGVVLTGHYRGGRWPANNLHWEILGTEGQLQLSAPSAGFVQTEPMTVWGGRYGATELEEMPVPAEYVHVHGVDRFDQAPAFIVAHLYHQLLADLRDGTSLVAAWSDAVQRHVSIDLSRD